MEALASSLVNLGFATLESLDATPDMAVTEGGAAGSRERNSLIETNDASNTDAHALRGFSHLRDYNVLVLKHMYIHTTNKQCVGLNV